MLRNFLLQEALPDKEKGTVKTHVKTCHLFSRHRLPLRQAASLLQPKPCPGTGLSGMQKHQLYIRRQKHPRRSGEDEGSLRDLVSTGRKELEEIDWSVYDDILFVSKSIGTIIAASYVKKHGLVGVRQVLYTPLAETFSFAPEKGACLYRNSGSLEHYGRDHSAGPEKSPAAACV